MFKPSNAQKLLYIQSLHDDDEWIKQFMKEHPDFSLRYNNNHSSLYVTNVKTNDGYRVSTHYLPDENHTGGTREYQGQEAQGHEQFGGTFQEKVIRSRQGIKDFITNLALAHEGKPLLPKKKRVKTASTTHYSPPPSPPYLRFDPVGEEFDYKYPFNRPQQAYTDMTTKYKSWLKSGEDFLPFEPSFSRDNRTIQLPTSTGRWLRVSRDWSPTSEKLTGYTQPTLLSDRRWHAGEYIEDVGGDKRERKKLNFSQIF